VTDFRNFYDTWRALVRVQNGAQLGADLYFQTDRDRIGFEEMPDFFATCAEEWAVSVTQVFETGASLAARLDSAELAKFRMIQDRHLINLMKMRFDEEYHCSSDERALFLIFHKVPPVRFCSAMARAKNRSLDILSDYMSRNAQTAPHLICAMTTAFMLELHHTLRAFIYFERFNSDAERHFEVAKDGDEITNSDYSAPTRNRQMTLPDKGKHGSVELF